MAVLNADNQGLYEIMYSMIEKIYGGCICKMCNKEISNKHTW